MESSLTLQKGNTSKDANKSKQDKSIRASFYEVENNQHPDIIVEKVEEEEEHRESKINTHRDLLETKAAGPSDSVKTITLGKAYSSKVKQIEDHFGFLQKEKQHFLKSIKESISWRNFMKVAVFALVLYNVVFIPLQFAYRISYNAARVCAEILTITFYSIDIVLRIINYKQLVKTSGTMPLSSNEFERKLNEDKEEFFKRLRNVKIEIICSIVALVPFSLFFELSETRQPLLIINTLCLLRLVKIWPIYKILASLKKRSVDAIRIVEVVITYYIACHIVSCYVISLALHVPDARDTWLRRVPVPQPAGFRESGSMDDVSPGSIYVHSLYFTVNTISHVAIGDVTMVTTEERVFNAFLILCGTFIYSFLFGNIASIVADFAPNLFINFHENYQYVMARVQKDKTPKQVISNINYYYDYLWAHSKGVNEEQFIRELPHSVQSDIYLCRYTEAIENSLIFKDKYGQIDVPLANSILRALKVRVYLRKDFIVKVGSYGTNLYIMLDGEAAAFGINNELLGFMKSGSHFSNDIGGPNFQNKRIVHLIARSLIIVGVLRHEDLETLYEAYPDWKEKVQTLNGIIHKVAAKNLTKYVKAINMENNLTNQVKCIENHITYSTGIVYENILNFMDHAKFDLQQSKEKDLLSLMKRKYY